MVRPVRGLAALVALGDRDGVDGGIRGLALLTRQAGRGLRRAQTGLATGYLVWIFTGAVLVGVAGVVLS